MPFQLEAQQLMKFIDLTQNSEKSVLEYHDEEQIIEAHQNFYDKVLSENGVLA